MSMKMFTLMMNKICVGAPKIMRKVATTLDVDLLTISY